MLASFNNQLGAAEGTASLVDGLMVLRSASPGDSELEIGNTGVNGTGEINFPSFQVTQNGSTNSQSISSTVYDGLGRAHTMVMDFTQADTNSWNYEASFLDGEEITGGATGTVTFDESGNLTSDNNISIDFEPGSGAEAMNFNVKLGDPESGSKLTQYAGSNSAQFTSQDGYAQGDLVDFDIDGGGNINGIYSNGQNTRLAQLAIGNVSNRDGLEALGSGLYRKTDTSGDISTSTAPNLADTKLSSGVLEGSNVELAQEFTDMITSQRAYQSNARVITTADELLQEVVNLKR
jgi:flagellar hook protein FlgE